MTERCLGIGCWLIVLPLWGVCCGMLALAMLVGLL